MFAKENFQNLTFKILSFAVYKMKILSIFIQKNLVMSKKNSIFAP